MSAYLARLDAATQTLGRTVDEWANAAIFGGAPGQTVSEHAAIDARAGRLGGCMLCALLSLLVQWRHCAKTLDPAATTPTSAFVRAGLAFLLLFGAIGLTLDRALAAALSASWRVLSAWLPTIW